MTAPEKILLQMEETIDQLVMNAEKLNALTQQVIAQQELKGLQKKQNELIESLRSLDHEFHKAVPGSKNKAQEKIQARIDEKLQRFQNLNIAFIDNLNTNRGLIKFEIKKETKKPKKQ